MAYWLMKSEPETFGIEDLAKQPNQTEHWDGVRNYQVRNMMRDQMRLGDEVLFYHSNCKPPGIAGTAKIVREAYPDHTAFEPESKYFDPKSSPDNPRWLMVDVKLQDIFPNYISLAKLRDIPELSEMQILQKGSRLSVTPITSEQWHCILSLSGIKS